MLTNSIFEGNYADMNGAAIYALSSQITIIDCNFIANIAARGSIALYDSKALIQRSIFGNNEADEGGAIFGSSLCIEIAADCLTVWRKETSSSYRVRDNKSNVLRSNITIFSSNFMNNSAIQSGGALTFSQSIVSIRNSYFETNTAALGGAIYSGDVYINIVKNEFSANAVEGFGGGVCLLYSQAVFKNNKFTANSAHSAGGAINLQNSKAIFSSNTFQNNSAYHGGAISTVLCEVIVGNDETLSLHGHEALSMGTRLSISNYFQSNYAVKTGGALDALQSSIKFCYSIFKNNYANRGGAGSFKNGISFLNLSYFEGNRAHSGGAIYSEDVNTNISESILIHNIAYTFDMYNNEDGFGGALCLLSSNSTILSNNFTENSAISGGALYIGDGFNIIITDNYFQENMAQYGGAVYSSVVNITISGSNFHRNVAYNFSASYNISDYIGGRGGAMCILNCTTCIMYNILTSNSAQNSGGAMFLQNCTNVIINNKFDFNSAEHGGAILFTSNTQNVDSILGSNFTSNNAHRTGGAITINRGRINIIGDFINNTAQAGGGSVYAFHCNITIINSQFCNNSANVGGAQALEHGMIIITDCVFHNNTAQFGGAISLEHATIDVTNNSFDQNIAHSIITYNGDDGRGRGGVIYSLKCNGIILGNNFTSNSAGYVGGVLYLEDSATTTEGNKFKTNIAQYGGAICTDNTSDISLGNIFESNVALVAGGAVTIQQCPGYSRILGNFTNNTAHVSGGALQVSYCDIKMSGTSFIHNSATTGGAISTISSRIQMESMCKIVKESEKAKQNLQYCDGILILNNTASESGGGMYMVKSELDCQNNCTLKIVGNSARGRGGGIHTVFTEISVSLYEPSSVIYLTNNTASYYGGGIFMEYYSTLHVLNSQFKNSSAMIFERNLAKYYGGAIFVLDNTIGITCTIGEVHIPFTECFYQVDNNNSPAHYIKFALNNAASGSNIYGGLLDRCTTRVPNNTLDNIRLFNNISLLTDIDLISSLPVRICFCIDGVPDCNYQPPILHLYKGEAFKVILSAVDQVNRSISGIIRGSLRSAKSVFKTFDQEINSISENHCLNISFSIITKSMTETLFLFAEGPCGNANQSQRTLEISFYKGCDCPIGFMPQDSNTDCTCQCDSLLKNLTMSTFDCDINSKVLIRKGDFWLGVNKNLSGYLIYSHCPIDYCKPASTNVRIDLTSSSRSVAQCSQNRQGVLCSACQSGFSLSPSSYRCIKCPNYWPLITIITIIAVALAGIALVFLIMVLNLTVAFGTLNAIIFYANIVSAKSNTFLPFSRPNFFTVFIAILNLEFGIDFCLLDGLDAYWKTWLQLVFPMYVFSLVVIVILISKSSMRFSRLIGRRNPVATLATLILLSYAKLLNTIIAILSFKVPTYPTGLQVRVWAFDATVKYLNGKHTLLFIAAFFILLAGATYTSLLFFWQWLLHYQHRAIFKWVGNQKLCQFLEPYHAPYNFKHRYWTGLLLIARILLYISSAINEAGSTSLDLMAVGVTVSSLLFLKGNLANVYKTIPLNILEMVIFMNIIILCFAKLYMLSLYRDEYEYTHNFLIYTLVSITFVLFVIIVFWHIFSEIISKMKIWKAMTACFKKNEQAIEELTLCSQAEGTTSLDEPIVTTSVIDGCPPKGKTAQKYVGKGEFQELRKPLLLSSDSTNEYT